MTNAPELHAALQRLLAAFEADKKIGGRNMSILTSWETNSQAINQARIAIQHATAK